MKVGMIGLGKLGYPVAQAITQKGHKVIGCDPKAKKEEWIGSVHDVVNHSDIVFIAVQTPHDIAFEGITKLPKDRSDFYYDFLIEAIEQVNEAMQDLRLKKNIEVSIISTVLPGTIDERIKHLIRDKRINLTYNPAFIAMGTVIEDFLNPEFVLLGGDNTDKLQRFYKTITKAPQVCTDIITAEAIKVSYNTFITMKIVLANLWGEIAYKTGANFDDILEAWSLSTKRLISSRYLDAGMGDGGSCHPRDNIALSWLAKKKNLSHDLFEDLMLAREHHTEWLASLITDKAVIFGKAFKPESDLITGSPALLLVNILKEKNIKFIHDENPKPGKFNFIATKHKRYKSIKWPRGSTVVDPFRYIPDQEGVTVVRIGEGTKKFNMKVSLSE